MNLVAKMRFFQQAYFKGDRSVLGKCKEIEKQVDAELSKHIKPELTKQQSLF